MSQKITIYLTDEPKYTLEEVKNLHDSGICLPNKECLVYYDVVKVMDITHFLQVNLADGKQIYVSHNKISYVELEEDKEETDE